MSHPTDFALRLLQWHRTIDRSLPWKADQDPYKIWLSEIIMQQTRVSQGTPYYLRFVEAYPDIISLADAPEDEVMRLWQGLGYYSRARNLHKAAQIVRDDYGGKFPRDYKSILSLPGVGSYTASAIASFAYGDEYAAVDGNVVRVLSRYFGMTAPVDSSMTLNNIKSLAAELISGADPGAYNQALMDFGAMYCVPKSPQCGACVFATDCVAYRKDLVDIIPYKAKKIKKRTRYLHYFVVNHKGHTVIKQRGEKDIWQGLYEFVLWERSDDAAIKDSDIHRYLQDIVQVGEVSIVRKSSAYKHILTHQTLYGTFYEVQIGKMGQVADPYQSVAWDSLEVYGIPRLISRYLEDRAQLTLW